MELATFHVRGIAPLLFNNAQTADPNNKITRLIKKITDKRKKTELDYQMISELEWLGALYLSEAPVILVENKGIQVGGGGAIGIPGYVVEATLRDAARKSRNGKTFEASLMSDGFWPITYDGPTELEVLIKDERFIDIRPAGVQRNKIMRTRPIFRKWEMVFEVEYDPRDLSHEEVEEALVLAGSKQGFGDFRPRHGRFEVFTPEENGNGSR